MTVLVSTPLTSVNLLSNDIAEAAADVVRAAEQHGKTQTLCGIKPDQTEATFIQWGLKDADAVLLAYDMKVNTPLTTLNLMQNQIGVEGVKAIAGALPSTPLTSVNLLRNDIGEAAADIVRAAEQHGKIQTLCGIKPDQKEADFSGQYLKAADAVLLAYDIKVNAPLKTLKLNDAELPIDELKTATSVDLSSKSLRPTDAIIIASLMSMVNTPLTSLDISENYIGPELGKILADVLPR